MCPLYPLQNGDTPLHLAVKGGHTTCVERLLLAPGIDVNIKNRVSSFLIDNTCHVDVHVSVFQLQCTCTCTCRYKQMPVGYKT